MIKTTLCAVMAFCLLMSIPAFAAAEDLEMINRPVNAEGFTGLLFTTAPFTLPKRAVEIGFSTLSERSFLPDYSVAGYAMTISYGLSSSTEIALKGSYWSREDADLASARGFGDVEAAFKWNVLPPREYSARPSIAVLFKGTAPTGDRVAGTNSVVNWGAGTGLSVGGELFIEDYVMGYYADGMVLVQDLSEERKRDRYHRANAGILLPISKHRNLQMFLEYNLMHDRDRSVLYEVDYTAVTYGLRVVTTKLNLTIGTQFRHRGMENYDNSSRLIGILSIKI